jgi:predicted Fe-Mo cluster-binding NifX family protein
MKMLIRVFVIVIFAFASAAFTSAAQAQIRIAVATDGPGADAAVSKIAARAPHIVIFDSAGKLLEAHANPAASNPGGAGPALASWLAEKKVQTLIAGEFGDKLSAALSERKIRMVRGNGSAAKAVQGVKP